MVQLEHPVVKQAPNLQDKLFKLLSRIIQNLPDDTASTLTDNGKKIILSQLKTVVKVSVVIQTWSGKASCRLAGVGIVPDSSGLILTGQIKVVQYKGILLSL